MTPEQRARIEKLLVDLYLPNERERFWTFVKNKYRDDLTDAEAQKVIEQLEQGK